MANLDTLQGLIQLIEAAGGKIENRICIQKEAFLLAADSLGGFQVRSFSYHHYGPYSRELSDTLQFAVASNLLEETPKPGVNNSRSYAYSLTDNGRRFLKEGGSASSDVLKRVSSMKGHHWKALELAATVRFLEIHQKSFSRKDAFVEALRLKPKTADYKSKAAEVLNQIMN